MKLKLFIALLVVIAGGVGAFLMLKPKSEEVSMVTIVAVTPNYSSIQIPQQQCRNVTSSKMVKNKNAGWWSTTFDSKNHPKYIKQSSSRQVCNMINLESQVINNYTIQYQFGQFVESMVVLSPPALNAVMPLTDLQKYQQETTANNASAAIAQTAP